MRMDSVEICNEAIGLCGSTDFIQSLSDANSVMARRCNQFYLPAIERVLRKHDWNCATIFVELAENSTAPVAEFENSFSLPFDCVKVINVYTDASGYNPYERWRIVKRDIHTDSDSIFLKYVAFPEDVKDLDILLASTIAHEIAVMLAPTVIKDKEVYSILFNSTRRVFSEAAAMDTLENKFLYTENDVWSDARASVG